MSERFPGLTELGTSLGIEPAQLERALERGESIIEDKTERQAIQSTEREQEEKQQSSPPLGSYTADARRAIPTPGNGHSEAKALPGIDFCDMRAHLSDSYVVKGLISRGSTVAIIGPTGSGKTFCTTDLAVHIAASRHWRRRRVAGGLVVYAALEGPASAENRFVACRDELGIDPGIPLRLTPGPVNLRNLEDVALLIAFVKQAERDFRTRCAIVIIDTLSRAIAGGDENAPEGMGALVTGADTVRLATGAAVLLVHHTGKDESRGSRGHSNFPAAIDTEIAISMQGDLRVATVTKQRDFPSGERFAFRLRVVELGHDNDGDAVTSCVIEPVDELPAPRREVSGKNQTALLAAIQEWHRAHPDRPTLTSLELRQIGTAQKIAPKRLQEAAQGLERFGWLRPAVGGWIFLPEASA
jgi:hypothetical protein